MTRHGGKIPDVTPEAVTAHLARASDAKAVKRLTAAREYLAGLSPAEIEDKYGYPEQTVYEWLDRIEESGLAAALDDETPPGRPARLSDSQWATFEEALQKSPVEAGFDAEAWTSTLAREFIQAEIDVEFSRRHVRRLLQEAASTGDRASEESGRRAETGSGN